jgi:hypothetical protein
MAKLENERNLAKPAQGDLPNEFEYAKLIFTHRYSPAGAFRSIQSNSGELIY